MREEQGNSSSSTSTPQLGSQTGGQFGFGAEVGISTQKLHVRGPMGLREITTTKYIVYGSGQIKEIS